MSELLPCPFCGQVPISLEDGIIEAACEAGCPLYRCWYTVDDWLLRTPPPATARMLELASARLKHQLPADRRIFKAFIAEWTDHPTLSSARSIDDSDTAT